VADNWYYQREGQTWGPISTEDLCGLAYTGELEPTDLIWQEGTSPEHAVPAAAAIAFGEGPTAAPLPANAPDWLDDVRRAEDPGLPTLEDAEPPDWLDDLEPPTERLEEVE
jgi:hypothetical protein